MKAFFIFLLSLCCLPAPAQKKIKKESFYLFNSDWKPASLDSASYLLYVQKFDDTTWRWNYYNLWGSLINIETYRDEAATEPNGYFAYFNKGGRIDSCGFTLSGLKHGTWLYFEDSLRPQYTRVYERGRLIKEDKSKAENKDEASGDGKEAQFRGGAKEWIRYLKKNLNYPDRAANKKIAGTVRIYFVISTSGEVEWSFITQSVEFSLDKEAMRLINESPSWTPGERDGQKVKAYRVQPITFAN